MIQGPDYTLELYIDGEELEFDNSLFFSFILYEQLQYGLYYGLFKFLNQSPIFRDHPFITGMKIEVRIEVDENEGKQSYKFVLFDYKVGNNIVSLLLAAEVYLKIGKDEVSKGYNDTTSAVVKTIADAAGITVADGDLEKTSAPKRKFLQVNQTDFDFVKDKILQAHNGKNSNYIFFINKDQKLKFYSINKMKSRPIVAQFHDDFIPAGLTIDDRTLNYQMKSGFGAKGYYFDWDNGSMGELTFDFNSIDSNAILTDKLGINKAYKNNNNKILMLSPIGEDLYFDKKYNEITLENTVLRKNYFNIFINFNFFGNLKITPAEIAEVYFNSASDDDSGNKMYNGKWIINDVAHIFASSGYTTNVTLVNSFLYGINSSSFE